jgi:hypothetical protein
LARFAPLLAGNQVVNRSADVGGVVANPLDVLGADNKCVHMEMLRGSSIMYVSSCRNSDV